MITADTHIIIWNALKPEMLSDKARKALSRADRGDGIIICEISLWEISMLIKKKRLIIDMGIREFLDIILDSKNYILKGITPEIAEISVNITGLKGDPADRIIAATSIAEKTALVTADDELRRSEYVKTVW